ncbi:MAG: hypothetical protein Q4B79_08820 [Moraxella sp.]|nr:hypothetical protein [Moraxella sp.]MDO4451041.1 hypothetical protein [Moraxella sp.]
MNVDERRGIKQIGFEVPITFATELDELAKKQVKPKTSSSWKR